MRQRVLHRRERQNPDESIQRSARSFDFFPLKVFSARSRIVSAPRVAQRWQQVRHGPRCAPRACERFRVGQQGNTAGSGATSARQNSARCRNFRPRIGSAGRQSASPLRARRSAWTGSLYGNGYCPCPSGCGRRCGQIRPWQRACCGCLSTLSSALCAHHATRQPRVLEHVGEPTRAPHAAPIRDRPPPLRTASRSRVSARRAEDRPEPAFDALFLDPMPDYENRRQDLGWLTKKPIRRGDCSTPTVPSGRVLIAKVQNRGIKGAMPGTCGLDPPDRAARTRFGRD